MQSSAIGLIKIAALVVFLFLTFRVGGWWAVSDLSFTKERLTNLGSTRAKVEEHNKTLESRNKELTERLASIERRVQVDQITYDELTQSLDISSNHIAKLKEELNFYRSIFSPANNLAGMQVHDLRISRDSDVNGYNYTLSVIQALKHDDYVLGDIQMLVEGLSGGQKQLLDMGRIGTAPGQMNFKYFQTFTGLFALPDGFKPMRVKINLVRNFEDSKKKKNKKPIRLEQWYPWPAV